MRVLMQLIRDDGGQGMGEYALILALVAIGVILTLTALGGSMRDKFNQIKDSLTNATAQ